MYVYRYHNLSSLALLPALPLHISLPHGRSKLHCVCPSCCLDPETLGWHAKCQRTKVRMYSSSPIFTGLHHANALRFCRCNCFLSSFLCIWPWHSSDSNDNALRTQTRKCCIHHPWGQVCTILSCIAVLIACSLQGLASNERAAHNSSYTRHETIEIKRSFGEELVFELNYCRTCFVLWDGCLSSLNNSIWPVQWLESTSTVSSCTLRQLHMLHSLQLRHLLQLQMTKHLVMHHHCRCCRIEKVLKVGTK